MKTINRDGEEWVMMTDKEADEQVKADILDSLWAFNASFISSFCGGFDAAAEKSLTEMQGKLCESANPLIAAMIKGREDEFVRQAVKADGRGHFLSSYDGEEYGPGDYMDDTHKVPAGKYAYRIN